MCLAICTNIGYSNHVENNALQFIQYVSLCGNQTMGELAQTKSDIPEGGERWEHGKDFWFWKYVSQYIHWNMIVVSVFMFIVIGLFICRFV